MWQAPINNRKKQTQVLKQKVAMWAKVYQQSKWAKTRAVQVVSTRIMKGVEYPLVATTLTKTQCNKIQKPLGQAIKKTLSLQKRISKSIMQGAAEEIGIGLQDIYDI